MRNLYRFQMQSKTFLWIFKKRIREMDEIKDLINLICKDELYDARNKLDVR